MPRGRPPITYNFDWTKRDIDLAKEHGLSRERIRQIRRRDNISNSPFHKIQKPKIKLIIFKSKIKKEFKTLTLMECKEKWNKTFPDAQLKEGYNSISSLLRNNKIEYSRWKGKIPWELFNFNLLNKDLQMIWGVLSVCISRYRKSHHKHPSPYFSGIPNNYEYLLNEEIKKLKEYLKEKEVKKINLPEEKLKVKKIEFN